MPTTTGASAAHRTATTESAEPTGAAGPAATAGERADKAAHSVRELFGGRALGVPGTLLGAPAHPRPASPTAPWHYWWQAHLLDALVDAGLRHLDDPARAREFRREGHRLLRGITLRSGGRVTHNSYYDDMAWLLLAVGRLAGLDRALTGRPDVACLDAGSALLARLERGHTGDLGGGVFWNTRHDVKNTASSAPTALGFVRTHRREQARAVLGWLRSTLWNPERKVFHDGLRLVAAGSGSEVTRLDERLFSYNSGPVLGALLELADAPGTDEEDRADLLRAAADVVAGAAEEYGRERDKRPVLRTHGGGDGGLFSGILARYLAEAALHPDLPAAARRAAAGLVTGTADALWAGRREFDPAVDFSAPGTTASTVTGDTVAIFSPDPARHADESQRPGVPVELSTQVQAWTVLEAAARLARP
ncbi:glycoside hydrolase family 76 protein [uncultured Kocuria sp.]|uniref:glycoside hydrolase family 76 protein n=1 Tax=uncultured Kocuria sp. TaxID=259305 RepID=UPI00260A909C|nr:glycoside hydrolase family 76 protein [uncultured Kocuria sp.]